MVSSPRSKSPNQKAPDLRSQAVANYTIIKGGAQRWICAIVCCVRDSCSAAELFEQNGPCVASIYLTASLTDSALIHYVRAPCLHQGRGQLHDYQGWYRVWDSNPQCIFVRNFEFRVSRQFHQRGIVKLVLVEGYDPSIPRLGLRV